MHRKDANEELSRKLSEVLRHTGPKLGLKIGADGYTSVSSLLKLRALQKFRPTEEHIRKIVADNDKQRFGLWEDRNGLWIRANQGHSVSCVDLELLCGDPLLAMRPHEVCCHGTYEKFLPSILQNGLRAGGQHGQQYRRQIHFSTRRPGEQVLSGMHASSQIAIYVDVAKAVREGIRFYRTANDVILTEGRDGVLSVDYIHAVWHIQKGTQLWPQHTGGASSGSSVEQVRGGAQNRGGHCLPHHVANADLDEASSTGLGNNANADTWSQTRWYSDAWSRDEQGSKQQPTSSRVDGPAIGTTEAQGSGRSASDVQDENRQPAYNAWANYIPTGGDRSGSACYGKNTYVSEAWANYTPSGAARSVSDAWANHNSKRNEWAGNSRNKSQLVRASEKSTYRANGEQCSSDAWKSYRPNAGNWNAQRYANAADGCGWVDGNSWGASSSARGGGWEGSSSGWMRSDQDADGGASTHEGGWSWRAECRMGENHNSNSSWRNHRSWGA